MPPTAVPQDRKRKAARKVIPPVPEPTAVTTEPQAEPTPTQMRDRYAPTVWGGSGNGLEDLELPSGQVCLVRRPGVQRLMEAGVLRDIDSLSAIVSEEHVQRVNGESKIDLTSLANDASAIDSLLSVVDRVLLHCVIKPQVLAPPETYADRDPQAIYTDMVDIEDKMFIFQFAVGGTRSVEQFRAESLAAMGSVEPVQAVEDATK